MAPCQYDRLDVYCGHCKQIPVGTEYITYLHNGRIRRHYQRNGEFFSYLPSAGCPLGTFDWYHPDTGSRTRIKYHAEHHCDRCRNHLRKVEEKGLPKGLVEYKRLAEEDKRG
ncbi:hypothetical protein HYFRA_00013484 [Hymenoscyphus fraxineus]|uniref:Uncharacterized protein n=1 Tax=Hymenoscyphus fraxineus TaxID=746836 RepID=A0A9N9L5H7_9HELO|nr:hypothetical protein HYFRA_00013484 [Hymenoscyphus fraxineus]